MATARNETASERAALAHRLTLPGWVLAVLACGLAIYMIFAYVPLERTQGWPQKIFYIHVPLAWNTFLMYTIVFIGSIAFLMRGSRSWDRLALAAAELGVILNTLVLISGSAWGRKVWGAWWTWDARLTSTLILWFIFLGYLMVRSYGENDAATSRLAAVIGIIGFLDIPLIWVSVRMWRSLHPTTLIFENTREAGLDPAMKITLLVTLAAFTLLALMMFSLRARMHRLSDEVLAKQIAIEEEDVES